MRRNFLWAGALALSVVMSSSLRADIILVDLTTDLAGSTGALLDSGPNLDTLAATPLTANVVQTDSIGNAASIIGTVPGLVISVTGGSFDPANSNANASGTGFGVDSPTPPDGSENPSRLDVDAAEFLEFTFNQDINLLDIHFTSFSGNETFTAGGVTFNDSDVGGNNIGTFADDGLFLAAGTAVRLEAGGPAGSSVGLEGITIETIAVPEPSSLLGLMGLAGLLAAKRRRK